MAYYLVIYLPKKDIEKLDYEKKQKLELQSQYKNEYDSCLEQVTAKVKQSWLGRCESNNIQIFKNEYGADDCNLPDDMSKRIIDQSNLDKETCLKIYQSK